MKTKKVFGIAEKLEIVQTRQQGLSLADVAKMYGASQYSIRRWAQAYERSGLAGLETAPTGRPRKLSQKVQAAEQIVKDVVKAEPEAGIGKIQGALSRQGFLQMARETVRSLLRRNGVGPQEVKLKRRNKPIRIKSFERACPNDLWQTDIMTFMLKGQYRVYMIGFMDDNSRFLVGWGLYRFQKGENVMEVFRAAIEKRGMPKEVLSDNGRQYHSWRGTSKFTSMLTKLGIRHIRSRPYHPQTCGKIESFWRNLNQECLTKVPLATFEEAQGKIGEYVEYYNFKRPHQGIGNLIPSDRYYGVAGQVKQIIAGNTAAVQEAMPTAAGYTPPTYLVGNIGGKELRLVAKDAEVTLTGPEERLDGNADKTGEPAGAAGADPAGDRAAGDGGSVVPAGGSIAGTVLPVDEAGAGGGAESAGGEAAGAEGCVGEPGEGAVQGAGAAGASGSGAGEAAQGAELREAGCKDCPADNSAQCLGAVPGV
ncbi:MAG: IS3 family transposase [Elusimicrobiales bacterium]|nr:IS3 family transposase [Elusimicrobiales bacterium]